MKSLFLVKAGEYSPNLFSEVAHLVNNSGKGCFSEMLRFVKRSDFTFKLYRRSSLSSREPLALVTYAYDPLKDGVSPDKYFPIETQAIREALDTYEFVLVGKVVPEDATVSESAVLTGLQYLARDRSGRLVDLKTGELVVAESNPDGPGTATVLSMFGVVKLGPLPVYYMVLDNGTTSLIDFMEYADPETNTVVFPVLDYDGTVASHLMNVKVSDNVTRVGKNSLFVKGTGATLDFFTETWCNYLDPASLASLPGATISGTCEYTLEGSKITLKVNKPVSYLKIEFDLGRFFDMVQSDEKPSVEFVIYAE